MQKNDALESFGELEERVNADLRGRQLDQSLFDNLDDWETLLLRIKGSLDAQRSRRKADLDSFRVECLRKKGEESKMEYLDAKAAYSRWKASTVMMMVKVEDRLALIKKARRDAKDND